MIVPCDLGRVRELVTRLQRWADSRDLFGMSIESPAARVSFSIGGSSDLISTTDRPVLFVQVTAPKLEGLIGFQRG